MKQFEANIKQKNTSLDVQLHKERINAFVRNYNLSEEEAISAIELMDSQLKRGYTKQVVSLARKKKMLISRQTVRLVKMGHNNNQKLFKYLLELAAELKANEVAARKTLKEFRNT